MIRRFWPFLYFLKTKSLFFLILFQNPSFLKPSNSLKTRQFSFSFLFLYFNFLSREKDYSKNSTETLASHSSRGFDPYSFVTTVKLREARDTNHLSDNILLNSLYFDNQIFDDVFWKKRYNVFLTIFLLC